MIYGQCPMKYLLCKHDILSVPSIIGATVGIPNRFVRSDSFIYLKSFSSLFLFSDF